MLNSLKVMLAHLRAWMAENERAHREAKSGACCSAPALVYAARREKNQHE